ncbi:MAG: hypothetical protein IT514_15115 [Burkholderiales bacterium]|nr:hypothetical protein [Burkholderiales bacterium]
MGVAKTLSASGLIVNDGNGGANYAITYVTDTTGAITAAPLTVTAQTDTRGYNGTAASSVAPVVSGTIHAPDTVGATATQSFDTRNAGAGKTLSASGLVVNDGNGGNNYAITYVTDTTGVITAVPLTVTADGKSRAVLQPNPPFTATYSGFISGEGVSELSGALIVTTPAGTLSPPGSYPLVPSGQSALNYALTYVNGTLIVTPASAAVAPPGEPDGGAYLEALAFTQQRTPPREPVRPGSGGQVYEVESTGIRLPAGLAR